MLFQTIFEPHNVLNLFSAKSLLGRGTANCLRDCNHRGDQFRAAASFGPRDERDLSRNILISRYTDLQNVMDERIPFPTLPGNRCRPSRCLLN